MGKPKLADYGLRGIDSRPSIDTDAHPISLAERSEAMEALIRYQVETKRVAAFRHALREWEWNEGTR